MDDWAKERAEAIMGRDIDRRGIDTGWNQKMEADIATALIEERALAAEGQEQAYAVGLAEGQRSMIGPNPGTVQIAEAFGRGVYSVTDRLRNPDEALVEAVAKKIEPEVPFHTVRPDQGWIATKMTTLVCRALVTALEAEQTPTATKERTDG